MNNKPSCFLLLSLLLSGCYESSSDLIGDNAVTIDKFDSLIVQNNRAFAVLPKGKQAVLCELKNKGDLKKPCTDGDSIKLERTASGNYIIQLREKLFNGRHKYALWMRSEPFGSHFACVMWLGEDIVTDRLGNVIGQSDSDQAGPYADFKKALRNVAVEPLITRDQLKRIVSIYEQALTNPQEKQWGCLSSRTSIDNSLIALEGDNRHLKPFEAPRSNSAPQ